MSRYINLENSKMACDLERRVRFKMISHFYNGYL